MKKKYLVIILILIILSSIIQTNATTFHEYHNKFPNEFIYDDYPNLKIEQYYSDQWMIDAIKLRYERQ